MSIDSKQILTYPIWYALHIGNQDNAYGGVYAKIIRRNMGAFAGLAADSAESWTNCGS